MTQWINIHKSDISHVSHSARSLCIPGIIHTNNWVIQPVSSFHQPANSQISCSSTPPPSLPFQSSALSHISYNNPQHIDACCRNCKKRSLFTSRSPPSPTPRLFTCLLSCLSLVWIYSFFSSCLACLLISSLSPPFVAIPTFLLSPYLPPSLFCKHSMRTFIFFLHLHSILLYMMDISGSELCETASVHWNA